MNNNQKIATAMVAGAVAVSTANYIRTRRIERRKRTEIDAKLARDLAAINRAAEAMKNRFDSGNYHPRSITNVMDDFQFEIITAHFED